MGDATQELSWFTVMLVLGNIILQIGMFVALTKNHLSHLQKAIDELKGDFIRHREKVDTRLGALDRKLAAHTHDKNGDHE